MHNNQSGSATVRIRQVLVTTLLLLHMFSSTTISALEVASKLPALEFENVGELLIVDGNAVYQSWHSTKMNGRLTFINILAASREAEALNSDFLDELATKEFESNQLLSVNIIVSKKIPRPFLGFVKSNLKKNKKLHPDAILIDDRKGLSWQHWGKEDSLATVILLDERGNIIFYREGKMSNEDTALFLSLVSSALSTEDAGDQDTRQTRSQS